MRPLGIAVRGASPTVTVLVVRASGLDSWPVVEQVRYAGETSLLRRASIVQGGYLVVLVVLMAALHVVASGLVMPYLSDLSRSTQIAVQALLVAPCALVAFRVCSVVIEPLLDRMVAHWVTPVDRSRYAAACWRAGKRSLKVSIWDLPAGELAVSSHEPARRDAEWALDRLESKGLSSDQVRIARQLALEGFQGTFGELMAVARSLA